MNEQLNSQQNQVVKIKLDDIICDPEQPRKTISPKKLDALMNSFTQSGPMNPIIVRPCQEGKFMIITGERRYRAAQKAQLDTIDCIVRPDVDDQTAREMQLKENYHREDIPPIEMALAIKDYIEKYHVSQSEMSKRTGIPQSTISNRLALLNLPPIVHDKLITQVIGPNEAIKIAALPLKIQGSVLDAIASGTITSRTLEKLTQRLKEGEESSIEATMNEFNLISPEAATNSDTIDKNSNITSSTIDCDDNSKVKAEIAPQTNTNEIGYENSEQLDVDRITLLKEFIVDAIEYARRARELCKHYGNNVCKILEKHTKEGIPGILRTLVEGDEQGLVVPSCLLCYICFAAKESKEKIKSGDLSLLEERTRCHCGMPVTIGISLKCAHCGKVIVIKQDSKG